MAKASKAVIKNGKARTATSAKSNAQSVQLAKRGVSSSEDFRNLMVGMMTDVIQGNINPDVVNAACNAGRGLLRMIEMEYKATTTTRGKPSIPITRRVAQIATA